MCRIYWPKKKELIRPLNNIEKKLDTKLIWRNKVNNLLKNEYKKLFKNIDKLVFLKAPDFNHIFRWRLIQEQKLKLTSKSKKIMSKNQIKEFIMFYERITRHMMKNYSKISDLTIFLDKNHRSKRMRKF